MSDEKMRAEFEAAITKDRMDAGYDEPNLSMIEWEGAQVYAENYIQAAWWGWKQSRAALVVELPERITKESGYSEDDEYYNLALKHCQHQIEAAGIKIKE